MTPKSRDRNMTRVRRITGAVAGAALAACGLFAGLAASATQKAYSTTTAATTKKHPRATTTAATTTVATTTVTQVTVAPVIVTPIQSAPVASSGGS
jgi:hypothetical protein